MTKDPQDVEITMLQHEVGKLKTHVAQIAEKMPPSPVDVTVFKEQLQEHKAHGEFIKSLMSRVVTIENRITALENTETPDVKPLLRGEMSELHEGLLSEIRAQGARITVLENAGTPDMEAFVRDKLEIIVKTVDYLGKRIEALDNAPKPKRKKRFWLF